MWYKYKKADKCVGFYYYFKTSDINILNFQIGDKKNATEPEMREHFSPGQEGSCAVTGECCYCTGTASGCVPKLHSPPSSGDNPSPDSYTQPPGLLQAGRQAASMCAP